MLIPKVSTERGKKGEISVCKRVIFKLLTGLSDSQDVFRAMHPDPDIVRLYLKPLLIGELAPEEPNQERNKNVSEVSGLKSMWRDGDEVYYRANLSFSVGNQPSCLGGPAMA